MANDKKFVVKNGLQTQNISYVDSALGLDTISVDMLTGGTLSFSGSNGQLFSIVDSMGGLIYSVNDISGIPSIEVYDTGEVRLAETFGNVLIGTDSDNGVGKLQLNGKFSFSNYSVYESDGSLLFARDGTNLMRLDASGNLAIAGTVSESQTL